MMMVMIRIIMTMMMVLMIDCRYSMGVPGLAWEPSGLFTTVASMVKMMIMIMSIAFTIIIIKQLVMMTTMKG